VRAHLLLSSLFRWTFIIAVLASDQTVVAEDGTESSFNSALNEFTNWQSWITQVGCLSVLRVVGWSLFGEGVAICPVAACCATGVLSGETLQNVQNFTWLYIGTQVSMICLQCSDDVALLRWIDYKALAI
jgi:hypothetical protein